MTVLHAIIRRVEGAEALDKYAKPVVDFVSRSVKPRWIRNLLSGTYLGHPMHPLLTDLPIGAWGMATLLDTIGGRDTERAADILVAAGIVAAVPTAAAGLNDWSDTYGPETRVGLVHATAVGTALAVYVASAIARASGNRRTGKLLGLAGFAVLTAGGYLGGYLSFVRGVNVNRTAWQEGAAEWTAVLPETELPDGAPRRVDADGVPVMLYRSASGLTALAATCSHMGGPLDEGTVTDGCVTCPWHGSVFRLEDGGIVRGPATSPQPRYDARVRDGQIEVRAA
ncbi:MAG TPA: Rieske 2Fe-2S domain-containing protein [Microbacteriaceae bacterium]